MRILLFIGFLFATLSYAQAQKYNPIDTTNWETHNTDLKTYYESKFESFNHQLKNDYAGKEYRYLKDEVNAYQEYFIEQIDDQLFFYSDTLTLFTKDLLNNIISQNPQYNIQNVKLLFLRDDDPNAFTSFDHSLLTNLGLIDLLTNEQQFASVICHEVAHIILEHSWTSIEENMQLELDKELKSISKDIKKQKYGKQNAAFELFKEAIYNDSEISRQRELHADSLGYVLYSHLGFSPKEYSGSLKFLKELEEEHEEKIEKVTLDSADYVQYFNLPDLPFNPKWLKMEDFSMYNYDLFEEKLDEDSIRSHPELDKRIAHLKEIFPELQSEEIEEINPSSEYSYLKQMARYERLPNLYATEKYGKGIYITLKMLKEGDSETELLYEWLGRYFLALAKGKEEYTFNRYVPQVDPRNQSESMQQFLSFLWNLKMEEFTVFGEYYSPKENENN